ncbi:unnamed protein product, partial [Musa textilis]
KGRRDKCLWALDGEKRKKREEMKEERFRGRKRMKEKKELWEGLDGERREGRLARKRSGV